MFTSTYGIRVNTRKENQFMKLSLTMQNAELPVINAFFEILITSKEIHMHFLAQAILLFTKDVFVNG